jgi:hypothetical protein
MELLDKLAIQIVLAYQGITMMESMLIVRNALGDARLVTIK